MSFSIWWHTVTHIEDRLTTNGTLKEALLFRFSCPAHTHMHRQGTW